MAPISVDIGLEGWWQGARAVLENLASTYSGKWEQDVNVTEWWSKGQRINSCDKNQIKLSVRGETRKFL